MNKKTSTIQNAYDEWAEIYDTNHNPTQDLNATTIRQESLPLSGQRILEIGCGTGMNTQYLAEKGKEVTGIDFSEEMLAVARERVKTENVQFAIRDITKPWNFDNGSFDLVVANLVLEHVEYLPHIFREAVQVLDTGGTFYIAELHPFKQLRQLQAKYVSKKTGKEVLVDAFIHSTSEYVNEAISAGFNLKWMRELKHEEDEIPRLLTLLFEKL